MSTPTIPSSNTQVFTGATGTAVITKPTGLAVGDVLFAHVAQLVAGATNAWTLPAGWTQIAQRNNVTSSYVTGYKVADAADVAAANFTFTSSRTGVTGGILCRITGLVSGVELETSEVDSLISPGLTVLNFTAASTPRATNTFVVAAFFYSDFSLAALPSNSTYTSTPTLTFTEVADLGYRDGASDGGLISVAYANHTATTQITAYGSTSSHTIGNIADAVLALFNGDVSATAQSTLLAVTPTILTSQVGANSGTASSTLLAVTPTVNTSNAKSSSDSTQWTNETKPTATTWTNQDK